LAKAKLFSQCENSIINVDDEYGKKLIKSLSNAHSCSFDQDSEFFLSNPEATQNGCSYEIISANDSAIIKTKIPGKYTVFNSALAYVAATLIGIDKEKILNGINKLEYIDGRLERIGASNIYIDYAHTPKAMENVINTVRSFAPHKRLIVLFGCGGDRDREKRKKMGEIASKTADLSVITSDNSRSEDSVSIIKDILTGVIPNSIYCIIPKREDAIKYAVKSLGENDILLLLGKGHEKYEIDKRGKHPFNERKIVEEVLRMK
jgi:UDP-N-acetylmuramyl-tripeptide synthetase